MALFGRRNQPSPEDYADALMDMMEQAQVSLDQRRRLEAEESLQRMEMMGQLTSDIQAIGQGQLARRNEQFGDSGLNSNAGVF